MHEPWELAHLLAQAGLHVPACSAYISPIDGLWTHFPMLETTTPGEGRLDDEAIRLADIFRSATPHSLILLNEVLNGTSTIEALGLAYDVGARVALAGGAGNLCDTPTRTLRGARTRSTPVLPASAWSVVWWRKSIRPWKMEATVIDEPSGSVPARALGTSYASEIAQQHGISYPQLVDLLHRRRLIPDE